MIYEIIDYSTLRLKIMAMRIHEVVNRCQSIDVRSEVSLRMPYLTSQYGVGWPGPHIRLSKEGSPLLTLEGQRSVCCPSAPSAIHRVSHCIVLSFVYTYISASFIYLYLIYTEGYP